MTEILGDNSRNNESRNVTMVVKGTVKRQRTDPELLWEDVMYGDFSIVDNGNSNSSSDSIETEDLSLTDEGLSLDVGQRDNFYYSKRKADQLLYEQRPNFYCSREVHHRKEESLRTRPPFQRHMPSTPKPAKAHHHYARPPSPYPRYEYQDYQYNYMPIHPEPVNHRYQNARRRHDPPVYEPRPAPQQTEGKLSTGNRRFIRRQSIHKYNRDELYIASEDERIHLKLGLFFLTIGSLSYYLFFC